MKIRNDFVSNSSSTSFIIALENIAITKLDKKFFKLIGQCETLYFQSKDGTEYDSSLTSDVKNFFGKCADIYEDSISLDINGIKLWDKDAIKMTKRILNASDNVTCSYGCDDCGEYVGEATQVCTALELLYGIVPEGDDHFDYSSIKRLGVEI